ncbi:Serine/threonine-protein kinase HT1 [Leucoagaricus sp. SymC.cos]|nr:Serine/threonine-protein kinase HT1 [Leucoagaricus sp. SymC.cos]
MENPRAIGVRTLKRSDPSTIQDKFLVQYMGWYACPGDGDPLQQGHHGWLRWFHHEYPDMKHPCVDLFPDVSSYSSSELYLVPGLTTNTNQQTFLFSSRNPITVQRHFHWMAEYGIDGAFFFRWAGHLGKDQNLERSLNDEVIDHVREAAEKEGRVFAIQYSVLHVSANDVALADVLEQDWKSLVYEKGMLNSPNYLRENGKPVISLACLGLRDAGHTPALVRSIVAMFRRVTPGGAYIVGNLPTYWRTSEFDADPNPEFVDSHNQSSGSDNWNEYKRDGGRSLWQEIFNASRLGVRTMYGVSWDDYENGDALLPVVPEKNLLPQSDKCTFMALDEDGYDLPSDWYMRICGVAAEALHKRANISETFPQREIAIYWSNHPKDALNELTDIDISASVTFDPYPDEGYSACANLLSEIFTQEVSLGRRMVTSGGLTAREDAQHMVDFLSQVLDNGALFNDHGERARKWVLSLLSKIAKSAQMFPRCCELRDVQCNLTSPLYEGGFGYVCKGIYRNRAVSVKAVRLYQQRDSSRYLRAQAKEFVLLAHLSHPNVVPFYGVWLPDDKSAKICIVSPWMSNGDLGNFIATFPDVPRLPLLSDVSVGLDYLHKSSIVHADLKASNVLVSDGGRAMIADFGISHVVSTHLRTTTLASTGSLHWTAPELTTEDGAHPTFESDIWSFGCLSYEALTGNIPFHQFDELQLVFAFISSNITPLSPSASSSVEDLDYIDVRVRKLMERCFNYLTQAERPKSGEIVQFFVDLNLADHRPLEDSMLMAELRARADIQIDYRCVYKVLELVESNMRESTRREENEEGLLA